MHRTSNPAFFELSPAECQLMLEQNHVGRLAFAHGGRVDIQPVHYVLGDGWLYGRTSEGSKLRTLEHNWRVAFEVDEIAGLFEWRSVVVHGGFYVLTPSGAPSEVERWQVAVDALRQLIARTFRDGDPVPFRETVFGIAIQEISGRAASSRTV